MSCACPVCGGTDEPKTTPKPEPDTLEMLAALAVYMAIAEFQRVERKLPPEDKERTELSLKALTASVLMLARGHWEGGPSVWLKEVDQRIHDRMVSDGVLVPRSEVDKTLS